MLARGHRSRAHRDPAAVGHGIARVEAEVEQNLLELGTVGADHAQLFSALKLGRNVLADHTPSKTQCLGDDLVGVKLLDLLHLTPSKGQQLLGEFGGAVAGFHHFIEILVNVLAFAYLLLCQLHIAHDDHQQVVELVCNAPGKPSYGFELLRVAALGLKALGLFARTHVACNLRNAPQSAVVIENCADRERNRLFLAARRDMDGFDVLEDLTCLQARGNLVESPPLPWGNEHLP